MAFLTTTDIANNLPSGYDAAQVDRLLLSAEASLRSVGLVFDSPSSSARSIEGSDGGRSVFSITPASTISSVRIVDSEGVVNSTLTYGSDYITRSHRNISGYVTQIELLNTRIFNFNTLNVTALWGIFIDFSASSNYEQKLLRAGIVDWVRSQLNIKSGQAVTQQGITSASTGNSRVSYGSQNQSAELKVYPITEDPDFQQVLDWFYA